MGLSFECGSCVSCADPSCKRHHGQGLCQLANNLACYVDFDLRNAVIYDRLDPSEEGITHALVRLMAGVSGSISASVYEVPKHEESVTGADLRIDFTMEEEQGMYRHAAWLIQCKRADKDGDFEHLGHRPRKSPKSDRQFQRLLDAAGKESATPFYWLYGFTETPNVQSPTGRTVPGPARSHTEALMVMPAETVRSLDGKKKKFEDPVCRLPWTKDGYRHDNRRWNSWETLTHAECHFGLSEKVRSARPLSAFWCDPVGSVFDDSSLMSARELPGHLSVSEGAGVEPMTDSIARRLVHLRISGRSQEQLLGGQR